MLKLYLAGGAALAVLAVLAYARIEHGAAEEARTEAASAARQATYERAAGNIEARRSANTQTIIKHVEEGKRAVSEAPDLQSSMAQFNAAVVRLLNDADQPSDPDGKRSNPSR